MWVTLPNLSFLFDVCPKSPWHKKIQCFQVLRGMTRLLKAGKFLTRQNRCSVFRVCLRDALRRFPSTELQVAVEVEARRPRRQRVSTIPPTVACHGLIGLQDVARCCKMLQDVARCCKMLQDVGTHYCTLRSSHQWVQFLGVLKCIKYMYFIWLLLGHGSALFHGIHGDSILILLAQTACVLVKNPYSTDLFWLQHSQRVQWCSGWVTAHHIPVIRAYTIAYASKQAHTMWLKHPQ